MKKVLPEEIQDNTAGVEKRVMLEKSQNGCQKLNK